MKTFEIAIMHKIVYVGARLIDSNSNLKSELDTVSCCYRSKRPIIYCILLSKKYMMPCISLEPTKVPGIDLISPKILQTCAPILCQPLHHLFQCPLHMHTFLQVGRSIRLYRFLKLVTELQSRTTDLFHCSPVYLKF